jgi:hypothetical protein
MKVAYQEYEEAVQSLTIALQERKPKAVIDEAIRTLETKRTAPRQGPRTLARPAITPHSRATGLSGGSR